MDGFKLLLIATLLTTQVLTHTKTADVTTEEDFNFASYSLDLARRDLNKFLREPHYDHNGTIIPYDPNRFHFYVANLIDAHKAFHDAHPGAQTDPSELAKLDVIMMIAGAKKYIANSSNNSTDNAYTRTPAIVGLGQNNRSTAGNLDPSNYDNHSLDQNTPTNPYGPLYIYSATGNARSQNHGKHQNALAKLLAARATDPNLVPPVNTGEKPSQPLPSENQLFPHVARSSNRNYGRSCPRGEAPIPAHYGHLSRAQ